MNVQKRLERNIVLQYIIASLMWMRFYLPVIALFYIASQVSVAEFAIILAVFSAVILVFEIPSGVIADFLGKRSTLLISRFLYLVELYLVAFHNGFWIFLVAKIISGIAVSLTSGTDSALLFDTLKRLGRESEHKKISGRVYTISAISMACMFIVGAYLFSLSPKLPAIVSIPFVGAGFILTFFIVEPTSIVKEFTFRNSWRHFKDGLRLFWMNPYLKYLAFYSLIIGTAFEIALSLSSIYYAWVLIPVSLIGLLASIGSLFTAFASAKAHRIEERLGEFRSMILIMGVVLLGIFLLSFGVPYWGAALFMLLPFIQGFYTVLLNDYTNRHVGDSHRVTMLSINNMFDNIGVALLFPIIGAITKAYSLRVSFIVLASIIAVYLIVLLIIFLPVIRVLHDKKRI